MSRKPESQRAPRTRDIGAKIFGLGSGRTADRCGVTTKIAADLQEKGYSAEARVLIDALNISVRGAYDVARLPEDALLFLCKMVISGEARNLQEARRIADSWVRQHNGIDENAVTLTSTTNDMYRLTSGHNTSSVLLSAQDLITLSEIIQINMDELQEKALFKSEEEQ